MTSTHWMLGSKSSGPTGRHAQSHIWLWPRMLGTVELACPAYHDRHRCRNEAPLHPHLTAVTCGRPSESRLTWHKPCRIILRPPQRPQLQTTQSLHRSVTAQAVDSPTANLVLHVSLHPCKASFQTAQVAAPGNAGVGRPKLSRLKSANTGVAAKLEAQLDVMRKCHAQVTFGSHSSPRCELAIEAAVLHATRMCCALCNLPRSPERGRPNTSAFLSWVSGTVAKRHSQGSKPTQTLVLLTYEQHSDALSNLSFPSGTDFMNEKETLI